MNVSEWLIDISAKMAEMAQDVSTRETEAKEMTNDFYYSVDVLKKWYAPAANIGPHWG